MNDPKFRWTLPYRIIFNQTRSDEHGSWEMQLLDFQRARTGEEVPLEEGLKRYGWALRMNPPTPNDPLVGSENTPKEALARIDGVRSALARTLNTDFVVAVLKCKGCESVMDDPVFEPCPKCGEPVCDPCHEAHGGCGKCSGGEELNDRAIETTPQQSAELNGEIADRAHKHNPMAEYGVRPAGSQPANEQHDEEA